MKVHYVLKVLRVCFIDMSNKDLDKYVQKYSNYDLNS